MKKIDERIRIMRGDITTLKVDAIVNAANSSLMGGGGVDGAIHRAGGAAILAACREIRSKEYPHGLPTGQAVITGSGQLPCRRVIHTVGPVWNGGEQNEREQLSAAYRNSLALAAQHHLNTLAFPAISTGVYAFPKEDAAKIAIGVVRSFLADSPLPKEVIFVFFSDEDMELFRTAAEL
jgi:O-acetyl-ADP-ribose deacetylase